MPSMQALRSIHGAGTAAADDGEPAGFSDIHEAATSPSGRTTPGVMRSTDLSAQGAAEVLYTIRQSENDGNCEDDGSEPGLRPLCAFLPEIHPRTLSYDPGGHSSLVKCLQQFHGTPSGGGAPSSRARGASPARDSGDAGGSDAAEEQTVDGVPVDALGAGAGVRPMIAQWPGAAAAANGMTPLAMTPHGLVPLMHGGQPFLMPVQTMKGPNGEEVTVAVPQGMGVGVGVGGHAVGLVLPPEAPLVLSEECRGFMVAGGAGVSGDFVGLPVDGNRSAPGSLAIGHPSCGTHQPIGCGLLAQSLLALASPCGVPFPEHQATQSRNIMHGSACVVARSSLGSVSARWSALLWCR
jgi:hypothetical protein